MQAEKNDKEDEVVYGRPRYDKDDPLFAKKVAKAYGVYKSLRRVGKLFGISHTTAGEYVIAGGGKILGSWDNRKYNYHANKLTVYQKLINFEKQYGVPFPRNMKDIARLTGFKVDSVRRTFLRLRHQIQDVCEGLPDLTQLSRPGVMCEGTANNKIKVGIYLNSDIEEYAYQIDPFVQYVLLVIKRKNDPVIYRVFIKNIYLFREELLKYVYENS